MNEIVKRIRELVLENAEIEDKNLDSLSGMKLVEDLGYDSVGLIHLICELEEEFDIEIPEADAEKISTVGDVVEYIKANV